MRHLWACLKKDFLLLADHGRGLLTFLVLPLALLLLLSGARSELSSTRSFTQPFKIAVRDLDDTIMSRALIKQMDTISLFKEVLQADDSDTDETLFDFGAAAVITIPKDFFYKAYDFTASAELHLNGAMPLQASMVCSIVENVCELMNEDQRCVYAEYLLRYGLEGVGEHQEELYAEAANRLLSDVFVLLKAMVEDEAVESMAAQVERMLLAACLSLICLLYPLGAVSAIPTEHANGLLQRYRVAAGSPLPFYLSKLLCGLLPQLLFVLLLLISFSVQSLACVLLLDLIAYCAMFLIYLLFALLIRSSAKLMPIASAYLIVSLLLGGVLYPLQLYSNPALIAAQFTLPYYLLQGLCVIENAASVQALLVAILPVVLSGLLAAIACSILIGRRDCL